MKIKLTVAEQASFLIACNALDVKVEESEQVGKSLFVVIAVRNPATLYNLGMLQSEISNLQVKKLVGENETN
jgi:hypothetical protein